MKYIICFVIVFVTSTVNSQEWTTVYSGNYTPLGFIWGGNGWRPGNYQFAVNPYDTSIWFAWDNYIQGFDAQGNYFKFDDNNVPVFETVTSASTIVQIGFTSNSAFAVDRFIGLMRYDGQDWTIVSTKDNGNSICSEKDSVWVANDDLGYITWKDGFTQEYTAPAQMERIVSRKGEVWASSGYDSGVIYKIDGVSFTPFYASSTNFLLDDSNISFKFSPVTDTMFVGGEKGISLMYGGAFIDTLTSFNTIDMPTGIIREIEIDQNNNIWALFGTDHYDHSSVAYYDFSSNTWTSIYDNTNSPIFWGGRVSIELDKEGNLYVSDDTDLHVLRVNNWPQWLDLNENEFTEFSIYPNPSNGDLKIQIDESIEVSEIQILDLNGRVLESLPYYETITINKKEGVYLVRLLNKEGVIGTRKILIN